LHEVDEVLGTDEDVARDRAQGARGVQHVVVEELEGLFGEDAWDALLVVGLR
jgi:hypothetical protein